ncbi:hypothetical protein Fleli_3549 [Bernardetia litoralis DSM 6794]|uniref:Uncharacterized protein n=2 Tax=Bernardetia litoralis TaxID=999 RepID=I4API3_BERLS|nr:hypothetical protein Fleli_3549 [Bernardetia litoralis DSM 6794]
MKTPKYPNRSRNQEEDSHQQSSYSNSRTSNSNGGYQGSNHNSNHNDRSGNGHNSSYNNSNGGHNNYSRYNKREFMNYNKFSFDRIKRRFNLNEVQKDLFETVAPIEPSEWLKETMEITSDLPIKTEKARTEFILMPILLELRKRTERMFTIYSGEYFNVEPREGLAGPTDIILSMGAESYSVSSPVMSIVQAYKNNLDLGLGKCVAQMIAADIFNEREDNNITTIYGCVTTGEQWLFLRLEGDTIQIHPHRFFLNELTDIIGMFQSMLNHSKEDVQTPKTVETETATE